jgi:hypothetical protein
VRGDGGRLWAAPLVVGVACLVAVVSCGRRVRSGVPEVRNECAPYGSLRLNISELPLVTRIGSMTTLLSGPFPVL